MQLWVIEFARLVIPRLQVDLRDRLTSRAVGRYIPRERCHQEVAMNGPHGFMMKITTHPGDFIKHEILAPYGLSVTAAAKVLGVSRTTLSTLLNERARLSPEMGLRIEKAFGISMDTLMRMQNSYDIAQARNREGEIKVMPFKGEPLVNSATKI